MDEIGVVTVFLRNGGEVLLLKRSEAVGSYPGQWGAVAGHAEGDPDAMAVTEIEEETGLSATAVSHVRTGEPFDVVDEDRGTRWVVTPFLFDADTRAVETDWETEIAEWVSPTAIRHRDTVPDLWESYDRVRPTVETVAADTDHGSAYISLRALEVLRDEAAMLAEASADWAAIAEIATSLRAARPEMAAVRNRINRAMTAAAETGTVEAVFESVLSEIERAVDTEGKTVARASELLGGKVVFTLSRSGTVLEALEDGDPERVVVAESRPGAEGVEVAESLAEDGLDVVLTGDANIPDAVADADLVVFGADTVLADGDVVNKVGTTVAALAGDFYDVDRYAVCSRDKVSPDTTVDLDAGSPEELYPGAAPFEVDNPIFERVPGELINGVVTESGILDREAVADLAATHEQLADWPTG